MNKTIELNPNDIFLYNERGLIYDKLKKYEEAIEDFTKSIQLNSNKYINSGFYYERGLMYYKLREYEKALNDLNKAIELEPNYSKAYFERASVHSKLG